jgi:hypothetical protein
MKVGWLKKERERMIRSCLLSLSGACLTLFDSLFVLAPIRSGQTQKPIKFTIVEIDM